MSTSELNRTSSSRDIADLSLVWPSLLVALLALAGSLWLSIGMKLKACPLCFYQRTFVMGVVAVMGIGVLTGQRHRSSSRGGLDARHLPQTFEDTIEERRSRVPRIAGRPGPLRRPLWHL